MNEELSSEEKTPGAAELSAAEGLEKDRTDGENPEGAMLSRQERVRSLRNGIHVVEEDFVRTNTELARLRKELGYSSVVSNEPLERKIAEMRRALETAEQSLDEDERRYLGIPEGDGEDRGDAVSDEQKGEDIGKTPEGVNEKELRELREEMVDEYIKLHTETVIQEMREQFPEVENRDKAEQLTVLKIEASLRDAFGEYEETGTFTMVRWAVKWHGKKFKNESGDVLYITKVEMDLASSNDPADLGGVEKVPGAQTEASKENGDAKDVVAEEKGPQA
jgi:hypothetical protein